MTTPSPEPERNKDRGSRSAARLGAVQALYQIDATGAARAEVIAEFLEHRLGREVDGELYKAADTRFFTEIVGGTVERLAEVDDIMASAVSKAWPLDRLEAIMKAVLRAAIYELVARPDVPPKVVINEYVDVAHAFFEGREPGFVNAVLDHVARQLGVGQAAD